MKRIIISLLILSGTATMCFADRFFCVNSNPMAYVVTGIVEHKGRNYIEIRDEQDKVLKRFVYFQDDVELGERVRVRYEPASLRVAILKKMTKLEYKKDGQNLGYVVRQE